MKRDFPDSETAYPVDGISRGQSGAKPNRPELTSANGAPQGFLTKGLAGWHLPRSGGVFPDPANGTP